MKEETAWLIERANAKGQVYAPAQYFGTGHQNWTNNHMKAIRFCRKIDAENAIIVFGESIYKATGEKAIVIEHAWAIDPREQDN